MAPLSDKLYWTMVAALSVVTAAASIVMLLWPLPKPIVEVAKPAVVQSDGSTILERTDTQPSVRPPHVVPKGAKVERVVQVKVQPKISTARPSMGDSASNGNELSLIGMSPPATFTVDMSLIREKDGSKRVIASSPDGEIVGGLDIPIETLTYKSRVWAAGISVDPVHQVGGVWVERDIGRIRVGAEVGANRYHDFETRLRVGVTW